jgi:putative hydrolase of the HAD superfamily
VKAVVFDFYGTLAETPSWGPSWVELVAELGYELSPELRDRWWNDGIDGTEHDEHSQSRDHYVAWQQARVRGMLTEAEIPVADQDLLIARVREISGHRHIHAYPEIADMLGALRARGLALGICSNWDWDLAEAIDSAGLTDTTDLVVSSAWVGARKPHPRIYTHTLEQLGVEPESVLFVGDTWSCDVEGPTALGMRAVYVRRPHLGPDATAPEHFPESDRIHHVNNLAGLTELA